MHCTALNNKSVTHLHLYDRWWLSTRQAFQRQSRMSLAPDHYRRQCGAVAKALFIAPCVQGAMGH